MATILSVDDRAINREFLATQPRDHLVRLLECLLQKCCEAAQAGISRSMSVTVVDRLEMIQIEDHQHQSIALAARCGHAFLDRARDEMRAFS